MIQSKQSLKNHSTKGGLQLSPWVAEAPSPHPDDLLKPDHTPLRYTVSFASSTFANSTKKRKLKEVDVGCGNRARVPRLEIAAWLGAAVRTFLCGNCSQAHVRPRMAALLLSDVPKPRKQACMTGHRRPTLGPSKPNPRGLRSFDCLLVSVDGTDEYVSPAKSLKAVHFPPLARLDLDGT